MIAADTSTWIAFLEGAHGDDTDMLDKALEDRRVLMVPAVLSELLSDPKLPSGVAKMFSEIPLIEVESGYWERAGILRSKVLAKHRKARLGDALIAQSCVDRGVALLTRDRDFRAFVQTAGLTLILGTTKDLTQAKSCPPEKKGGATKATPILGILGRKLRKHANF